MTYLNQLAKPDDYVKHEDGFYYLNGKYFKAIGGAICNDPIEGAERYNHNILKLKTDNPLRKRAIDFADKYHQHYRLQQINTLITNNDNVFNISELSKINQFIFKLLYSFGQLERLTEARSN